MSARAGEEPRLQRPSGFLRRFIESEAAGGILLMGVAALALLVANSPAAPVYFGVLKTYVGSLSVLHWINDALMAVFFLLVGLEIKREVVGGQLATWPQRILPGLAALGGMAAPAFFYLAINATSPDTLKGWAIPAATDIAFALGVLSLLGKRVPLSLKVFLTALAIIDDLGAVIIIALFYTADLDAGALLGASLVVLTLVAINRRGIRSLPIYLVLGVALWFFVLLSGVHATLVLLSGVHATLAGVVLALTIPLISKDEGLQQEEPPLLKLEHAIQPWVAFAVIPIFGFANAGVSFSGLTVSALFQPVPLGIAAGLFLGKQIGVMALVALAVKLRWTQLPEQAGWLQLYGISLLCGIGFTMSLFIGLLAFPDQPALQDAVKLGVFMGSALSGIAGALVLIAAGSRREQRVHQDDRTEEAAR
nr:Na+/H+ antiporter 1 [uncultured bacterium]